MAWYNPFSWGTSSTVSLGEADILKVVSQLSNGIKVAEADANALYSAIAQDGPAIIVTVNEILIVVFEIVGTGDPRVLAVLAAIKVLDAALTAVVKAKASNENFIQALVDAYKAYQNLRSSAAQAKLAVIK